MIKNNQVFDEFIGDELKQVVAAYTVSAVK
jgi:hypothetical protein